MSRKITAKISGGRPIIIDFMVEGQEIGYELICPKCDGRNFLISLDKSRIACTNTDCMTVLLVAARDIADMSGVSWRVD